MHPIGTTGGHGHAPENAGHLTTAFASGRSDSEAGTESRACRVDAWTAGHPLLLPDEERPDHKSEYGKSTGRASC